MLQFYTFTQDFGSQMVNRHSISTPICMIGVPINVSFLKVCIALNPLQTNFPPISPIGEYSKVNSQRNMYTKLLVQLGLANLDNLNLFLYLLQIIRSAVNFVCFIHDKRITAAYIRFLRMAKGLFTIRYVSQGGYTCVTAVPKTSRI